MKNARIGLLFFGDLAALVGAFVVMLYVGFGKALTPEITDAHLLPFLILFGLWILVFYLFNLYEAQNVSPTIPHLRNMGIALLVCFGISLAFFYIVPIFGITPKTNLVVFDIVFAALFVGWRRLFYMIFSARFKTHTAIISRDPSHTDTVRELTHYIATFPQSGFVIESTFSSVDEYLASNITLDSIIVGPEIIENSHDFRRLFANNHNVIDLVAMYEETIGRIPLESIDERWALHNLRNVNLGVYEGIKRLISVIVSLGVLVVTSPILLITGLLVIVSDGGPMFYSQERVGKNGTIFKIHKFRSMVQNAEAQGAQWASEGDARVTTVGRVIRKLHIDEIPQLWNVITGDLSLVGPRPERPEFVSDLETQIPFYHLRHMIKPGFTGWAQIKFRYARSVQDSREKFEYDLYYIKNRNIFMDIGIIVRTLQIIFTH